jgi:hypothetical protein
MTIRTQSFLVSTAHAAVMAGSCLIVAAISLSCSDDSRDVSSSPGGMGASSGQGGSGGSPQGGSGGSAGSSSGGSSQGGVSGTSGTGGGVADVLNPNLPPPSYDCRTDAQTKQCVSIRGTIAGQNVDRYCALPDSPIGFVGNPPAWVTNCEQQEGNQSYVYRVDILVQQPGSFHHVLDPEDYTGADVVAGVNDAGGDGRSNHLVQAEIAGSVVRDPQTTDDIVTGTFRATWGDPPANCFPAYVDQCVPADVHGTFRVDYALKVSDFP